MIDIYSKNEYCGLSNFFPRKFRLYLDELISFLKMFKDFKDVDKLEINNGRYYIQVNSMEGAVQSLIFKDIDIALEICKLVGYQAKYRSREIDWRITGKLYFLGIEMDRLSNEYQILLNYLYHSMYVQCEDFREQLKLTGDEQLIHTIGHKKESETILTEYEFCRRLHVLRQVGTLKQRGLFNKN